MVGLIPPHRTLLYLVPFAAMGLIVLLLAAMLWLAMRNVREDERHTLIADALWVAQSLQFHFTSAEDKIEQLAGAAREGADATTFLRRARQVVSGNPELESIVLHDLSGTAALAVPPQHPAELDAAGRQALALAAAGGRSVYTSPGAGQDRFTLFVPVYDDERLSGAIAAHFSLDAVIEQNVPWWFAERYRLSVIDVNGDEIAARPSPPLSDPGESYRVPFDPPGAELQLLVTARHPATVAPRYGLGALIVFLGLTALISLAALGRHMRRRIEVEAALRAEHGFRTAMEDSLTVGMRARDLDGRMIYVNPAFCRMVGWPAEELIGRKAPMPYWLPEESEHNMALHKAVLSGRAPPEGFELRFRHKDGTVFDALIYEAPLIDADGRHVGWMGSVLDVTERKAAEALARRQDEKLQQTARLVTMGEMASTLAHELNQPLAAIASYNAGCLNMLRHGRGDPQDMITTLDKLGQQAQRAGLIIRRIHDFVRKADPVMAPCSLAGVIENVATFIQSDARRHGVRLAIDCAPGRVLGDRILLEQVVLNLARNGIEAMARTAANDRVLMLAAAAIGDEMTVTVSDRGIGIAAELAPQLFSPFFTTKENGMGMGLNICRTIVEHHHGRLWFEQNPLGGAVFRFALPALVA